MDVKIAHVMGVDVTLLSQSLKKNASSDPETFKQLAGSMIGGIRET